MIGPVSAAASEDLNQRIGDFAGLVGLVLVLITLFTSQRQEALRQLTASPQTSREPFTRELLLDGLLALTTVLLFLSGLPLFVDSASPFHPRSHDGPLRIAFLIVWALLPFLVIWQARLAWGARAARQDWDATYAA